MFILPILANYVEAMIFQEFRSIVRNLEFSQRIQIVAAGLPMTLPAARVVNTTMDSLVIPVRYR